MLLAVQVTSVLILTCLHAKAEAPPGYVKPTQPQDANPPKYEYGYNIEDGKGESHGKVETRDGIYALGRYYVQNSDSTHSVQYYADDWGYHPYIEYSNVGPHSRTRTQLLLGVEAVKALASNKFTPHSTPAKQHVTDTINSKIAGNAASKSAINLQQLPQPQSLVAQPQTIAQQQPQQILQQPQQIVQQPQQIIQQPHQIVQHIVQHPQQIVQQPQQILVEQPQQVVLQQQEIVQQPQQILVQNPQPVQQPVDVQQPQSDSVVVEANLGRAQSIQQSQPALSQPQLQQVLVQNQVTHVQPQLEQVQEQQQISHQQIPQLQLQQLPQAEHLQQVQDNSVRSQQSSEIGSNLISGERRSQELFDANQINVGEATLGGFGSRLNLISRQRPNYNVRIQQSDKLVETTRNLVSGQDVLNINGAANSIETSTARTYGGLGVTQASLINEPIVVADLNENIVTSTESPLRVQATAKEVICSTTANALDAVSSQTFSVTEPTSVLVTPRPISTQFFVPVTAGVQLQRVESSQNVGVQQNNNQRIEVEVQKSLPLYLGKFEYVPSAVGQVETKQSQAAENIELGKTLLAFPDSEQGPNLQRQQLPEQSIKDNFIEVDQQQAQLIQHNFAIQQVSSTASPLVIEKIVEKQVRVPVIQTQIVEKQVPVEKIVNHPYPVAVPVHVPVEIRVPVEKRVPYPVTVERIVDRPVKVTQFVEKQVHVPQPYPVEKIVERPVHVPVEVTKYVDRPYPVQVPVAQPVPYPVDRVVEKIVKQPYPVQVQVPVEVRVPYPVEKIVEKKVPVPQYIDRQVPVERIVEKPVPHYIDRPYPVHVQVPVPVSQAYILSPPKTYQVPLINVKQQLPIPTKTIANYQKQLQQKQVVQGSTQPNQYLPPQNLQQNNGYLPPHDCDQQNSYTRQSEYYTIPSEDYIGLSPPKLQGNQQGGVRKFRNARSNFNSNLRLEYGFMPPLRPSQEIDEHGHPIIREEQS